MCVCVWFVVECIIMCVVLEMCMHSEYTHECVYVSVSVCTCIAYYQRHFTYVQLS